MSALAIQVALAKATEASRLYPHYQRGVGLTLESTRTRIVARQVEVYAEDGEVLLGVDPNGVLADVDVHYGWRSWKVWPAGSKRRRPRLPS